MNAHEVDKVISGLQEFFYESAYHKLEDTVLESKLTALELDPSKVTVLAAVWTKAMHAVCEALGKKSVLTQVTMRDDLVPPIYDLFAVGSHCV